jgi:tripartite-type tricarboxylate transporter receptor subunit TctC
MEEMKKRLARYSRWALGIGIIVSGVQAAAQSVAPGTAWPTRPVRVVVPFAPGGSADTLGRLVAARLSESLGQSFPVENRAGAGGVLGSEFVARSAPDGYTLLVSGVASHAIAPALGKVPFDPIRDFTHIALFGGPPAVLAVHPSMPVRDLKSFIAFAKARPGQIFYGSPGNGTLGHLLAELFSRNAGIDIRHVPYKGAALAVVDVIGGHIHAVSTTLATAGPQIRAGRLRALAMSAAERLSEYPDVPTFRELGHPQLTATVWFSLSGPAGLPADIATRLNGEVRRALQHSEVRALMRAEGMEAGALEVKPFNAFMVSEIERWTKVIQAAGVRTD